MKRDMDIIRLLLIQHEQEETPPELSNYSDREILYNYKLMEDAGLITASFVEGSDPVPVGINYVRLTWAGHDFLDASRDNKIWKSAVEHVIKPGASWSFSILLEWLKQEARQKLFGLSSVHPATDPTSRV